MRPLLLALLACTPDDEKPLDSGSTTPDGGSSGDGGGSDGGTGDGGSGDGGSGDGGSGDGGGSDGGGSGDGGGDGDGGGSDGGGSGDGGGDGGSGDGGAPVVAPDYRETGSFRTSQSSGSTRLSSSCTIEWTRVEPTSASDAPKVVYAHGFLRSSANHIDVAEHLASWGLDVYLVDLCHSSVWDTDHEQNGLDMVSFAQEEGLASPLYIGHSAGGLSAIVAAASDSTALGVVGLDPVDAAGVGLDAAGSVGAPTFGVMGQSSACNASANGVEMVEAAPTARLLRIADADHCDFEGPSDWQCTTFCTGSNDTLSDAEIRETARALATAALLWASGSDESQQWWTAGEGWYDDLLADGSVTVP